MLKKLLQIIMFMSFIIPGILSAQEKTMEGRWKTIDDKTNKEKSVVLIWIDEKGNLNGKIEKLFLKPDEDQNPVCDKCNGNKKDAPIIGMQILWDFAADHKKGAGMWNSGRILDPKTGVVYSCNLSLDENSDKMIVRGFVGFSFIGRTQTWIRIAE